MSPATRATPVRTPVLDELARGGVFRDAYTPIPICIPGRQAMMSGQLPRTCGCERYGQDLPPFSMTFARRFARYAHETVCVGKLHRMRIDQMQGWTRRLAGDMEVGEAFIEASARVPLIVRWPRRLRPGVVDENVNLCDLFATLCDLAGIPTAAGLDSRSLVPLMDGDTAEWRSRYHNEMIDVPEVLFDLEHDPAECVNLIGESRYAAAIETFRRRRDALGMGPAGRGPYVNAGYINGPHGGGPSAAGPHL